MTISIMGLVIGAVSGCLIVIIAVLIFDALN